VNWTDDDRRTLINLSKLLENLKMYETGLSFSQE
jgi:hypothetical protein